MIMCIILFFFNDTATTEIYTLSLHDALPISRGLLDHLARRVLPALLALAQQLDDFHDGHGVPPPRRASRSRQDRKSTRLNSSHANISYAVFCLKKKNRSCPYHD